MRLHRALICIAGLLVATGGHAAESNAVYDGNCALCHQRAGAGLAGQFPRLAGRLSEISATAQGRNYLMQVTLFGMAGKIEVDGTPIVGVMPGFVSLSDPQIASVLNYLIDLEGPTKSKAKGAPVTESDVARVRAATPMTPTEVRAAREKIMVGHKK